MIYVLFIIFFSILTYDLRKGILLYAPFKLFFLSGIKLFESFSFDVVISILAVSMYFIKNYEHLRKTKTPWIYAILIVIIISIINGIFPEKNGYVLWSIFTVYMYAVIYFDSMNSKDNLKIAVYSIILFALIMCINGVIEYVMGINFLREIQQSMATEGTYFSENSLERFGITHRVCSCIPHAIGYGTVCVCFLYLILYIRYNTNMQLSLFLTILSLSLLFSGIVLSASRSPLLGLAIMLIPFFISKNILKIKNIILFSLLIIVAYYYAGEFLVKMFLSIVDENTAMEASGSGIEMRQSQYELTMMIWSQNPIFGHGQIALEQIDKTGMLRGAESLWFQLLLRRGIVGFVGFALFYFLVFRDIIRTQKERKFKLFFWISWIVINTVTSLPGITDFFALMILGILYKLEEFESVNTGIVKKMQALLQRNPRKWQYSNQ